MKVKLTLFILGAVVLFSVKPAHSQASCGYITTMACQNVSDPGGTLSVTEYAPTNKDIGYLFGISGQACKTIDGGDTFTGLDLGTNAELHGAAFLDANTGWVVGGVFGQTGDIFHTIDGGENWISQVSETPNLLFDVYMLNATTLIAVGINRYHPANDKRRYNLELGGQRYQ